MNPTYWPGTRLYLPPTWTQCQVVYKLKTQWKVQMFWFLYVKGGIEHSKLTALMPTHNPTHCDHNTVNISAKVWAKEQLEICHWISYLWLPTVWSCSLDCQLFIILSFYIQNQHSAWHTVGLKIFVSTEEWFHFNSFICYIPLNSVQFNSFFNMEKIIGVYLVQIKPEIRQIWRWCQVIFNSKITGTSPVKGFEFLELLLQYPLSPSNTIYSSIPSVYIQELVDINNKNTYFRFSKKP